MFTTLPYPKVPADLRALKEKREPSNWNDPLQESQILSGEEVRIIDASGPWFLVDLLNQPVFKNNQWVPYQGWVLKETFSIIDKKPNWCVIKVETEIKGEKDKTSLTIGKLPLGSRFFGELDGEWLKLNLGSETGYISRNAVDSLVKPLHPKELLSRAIDLIDIPYFWGGLNPSQEQGVDCSGLTHLLFRSFGKTIPRNAHDQFLKCERKRFSDLKTGDLLFSSEKGLGGRITHVMLFVQGNRIIEAVKSERKVRIISLKKKFNEELNPFLEEQELSDGTAVFYGSLFPYISGGEKTGLI